jgi:hypothetical protein
MKIISLRIDEEEKSRLEQMAEAGDVTLSRALREGAALYLTDLATRVHRARGGDVTWHGIRRGSDGRPLTPPTDPGPATALRAARLRTALYDRAFGSIQAALNSGTAPRVVVGAIAQWLDLVGQIYVGQPNPIGWDWFLRDYCPGFSVGDDRAPVLKAIEGALTRGFTHDVGVLVDSLDEGFRRFMDDAEHQEAVRRAVLPAWDVLERRLAS